MSTLKNKINFSQFNLFPDDVYFTDHKTLVIRKWQWDYKDCLEFQRFCAKIVQENPSFKILIMCNHPRVLTHGRGLQKPRKGETLNLVEFDFENISNINLPFFKIERGGGLTFHHPGQFIFYPILRLNPHELSLSKMIDEIFSISISILESWGLSNLSSENKLLGIWRKDKKIASMGIAISKLVTFHGMALNIYADEELKLVMKNLNPCGLQSDTYSSVEDFIEVPEEGLKIFSNQFIERIQNGWK